ncbi:hypothetical protein [uncultured Mediterranean phage uvMED]|nr:hypothetical protein [uncultured Mediterranean phage uvMED]
MTTQTTTHKENNMTKYYIYKYAGKLIKETYVFKDIIPYIKAGFIVKAKNKLKS